MAWVNVIMKLEITARLGKKRRLTIPTEIAEAACVGEGDMLDVEVVAGKIVLTPEKLIMKDQAWYWTPAWQAAEKEAQEQIDRGEVLQFDSVEDAIRELHKGDQ